MRQTENKTSNNSPQEGVRKGVRGRHTYGELEEIRMKMTNEIEEMEEENKLIEEGLKYIKFDEWDGLDDITRIALKIRLEQFANFVLEKYKEKVKNIDKSKVDELEEELKIINKMNDFDKAHTVTDIILLAKDNSVTRIHLEDDQYD